MIYQLINFKTSRWVWGLSVFGGVVFAALCQYSLTGAVMGLALLAPMAMSGSLWGSAYTQRFSLFEASLPVRARDFLGARVLGGIAWTWLFVITSLLAAQIFPSDKPALLKVLVFTAGSILTLVQVVLYAIRPAELSVPRWWVQGANIIGMLALTILFIQSLVTPSPVAESAAIIAICWLSSAALFLKTWTSVPESFSVAPLKSEVQKSSTNRLRLPGFVWLPAMRSFFKAMTVLWLCLVLFWGSFPDLFMGALFISVCCIGISEQLRKDARWLCSLPIALRTLFATATLIPLAFYVLGRVIHYHFSREVAGVANLDIAAVIASSLLVIFIVRLPNFAGRFGPGWARPFQFSPLVAAPLIWVMWRWFRRSDGTRIVPIDALFGSIPPERLPVWIAASALVIAILYGLAYAGFRQMEISPQRQKPLR